MTALAHLPEPVEKVYRCHNCGRRVHRYTRKSMEDGDCVYCWPNANLRDAMDAAREAGF